MTQYYCTNNPKRHTFKEFKDFLSGGFITLVKEEDCYDISYLTKEFKGFEYDGFYYDQSDYIERLELVTLPQIIRFTCPRYEPTMGMITYFPDKDKRDKGIRSKTRIGKFIKKVANFYTDQQVEFIVDMIKESYQRHEVTYHVSKEREDFKRIYTAEGIPGGYLGNYSCIHASCMRYDFDRLSSHPCEVYASGDFEIHWTEDSEGRIGARVLYCIPDESFGYIYASSQATGDQLKELIEASGREFVCGEDTDEWVGARLLKIVDGKKLIAPYIDLSKEVEDCGSYLRITDYEGDYRFGGTSGYHYTKITCPCCGDSVNHDDTIESDGELHCQYCVNWCEFYQEYKVGEIHPVYKSKRIYDYWCQEAINEYAVYDELLQEYVTKEYYEELVQQREEEYEDE